MERTDTMTNSKWSQAAKDGLVLAAVTVVCSTLSFLTKNSFLNMLLWAVKLFGSIWLLYIIMRRYGKAHPEEPAFRYGLVVCLLSAAVCAVCAFFQYQVLFPEAVAEAFEQAYSSLEQFGSSLPESFTDVMLKMEDNYAQINCISTFIWCSLLGLLFSAILSAGTSGKKKVFTPEEMMQNNEESNI